MNQHDFIFSNTRGHRLTRHLVFWLCWILFSSTVQLTGFKPVPMPLNDLVLYQLLRSISRLPSHILFCYVTVYFLSSAVVSISIFSFCCKDIRNCSQQFWTRESKINGAMVFPVIFPFSFRLITIRLP